jgi:hypothetical protein
MSRTMSSDCKRRLGALLLHFGGFVESVLRALWNVVLLAWLLGVAISMTEGGCTFEQAVGDWRLPVAALMAMSESNDPAPASTCALRTGP